MTVEWRESRWPKAVRSLLRLLRQPAAETGALFIDAGEPRALGRLTVEDGAGNVRCALIDSVRSRTKWFYLPAALVQDGGVLKDQAGETLFTLPSAAAATPDIQAAQSAPPSPAPAAPSAPPPGNEAEAAPPSDEAPAAAAADQPEPSKATQTPAEAPAPAAAAADQPPSKAAPAPDPAPAAAEAGGADPQATQEPPHTPNDQKGVDA